MGNVSMRKGTHKRKKAHVAVAVDLNLSCSIAFVTNLQLYSRAFSSMRGRQKLTFLVFSALRGTKKDEGI